ncbi:Aste57867_10310 [Aphanomyces stellatus]|uniref:Aste57867_10310 protein n=1 Tax=Aphanomyces stellatus TaxID=120398 RepID=A0A485KQ01_9STRA|nr:hypothetical protein As57867_010270 [Aphanomyces stellatus]VFT87184.1 Aste57867_10310 [Aphanomyces stellatus]
MCAGMGVAFTTNERRTLNEKRNIVIENRGTRALPDELGTTNPLADAFPNAPPPTTGKHFPFVILGACTTAYAAIEAILQQIPAAEILLISDEAYLPRLDYKESTGPRMSDALLDTYNEWRRYITPRLEDEHEASSPTVTLVLGKRDLYFDLEQKRLALPDGTEVSFDKCLIATAGKPRPLYVLNSSQLSYALNDTINTTTTRGDFEALHHLAHDVHTVSVIGGGFLATELAVALASENSHREIRHLFVGTPGPCAHELPAYLSQELTRRMEALGNVHVQPGTLVTNVKAIAEADDRRRRVSLTCMNTSAHTTHETTDYVVLAPTHIDPNVGTVVGTSPGFEIDLVHGGIVVNAQLEAVADVFVAGSAASYYDDFVGRRRVDRYDHAVNSGLTAGHNMATSGPKKVYRHQPMFRSHMAGIGVTCEGVGVVDSRLQTVGVWLPTPDTPFARGLVYYLRGPKIVGIVLWNAPDLLENARHVMVAKPTVESAAQLTKVISLGPDAWLRMLTTDEAHADESSARKSNVFTIHTPLWHPSVGLKLRSSNICQSTNHGEHFQSATRRNWYPIDAMLLTRLGFAAAAVAATLVTDPSLQGRCSADADCPTGAVCVTVDTGRESFSKCTAATPLCHGRTFGHCPSQDFEIGNLMCVFVASEKIRNVACCPTSTTQLLVTSPDGGATSTTTVGASSGSAAAAATTCFDCFKLAGSNSTAPAIPGEFKCVFQDQCKESTAFPPVCDTSLTCNSAPNEICSKHGTCVPIDSDAPQGTFRCLCDPGFGGRFCDKVISNDCISDCGLGGTCVKGQCTCNVGYTGDQCYGCTRNTTCNSATLAGACNLKTNTCDCVPGFQGDQWCGTASDATAAAVFDTCTQKSAPNCGTKGACANSKCYCLSSSCIGTACTPCALPGCADCTAAASGAPGSAIAMGPFAMCVLLVSAAVFL